MKPLNFKDDLVSVILPVRNAENFLEEALNSVIGQTYQNIEIIAVDDTSTDKTAEILKKYQGKDTRIKVVTNKEQLGVAKSLNVAIKNSSGVYLARMDADDLMQPTRLEKQINYLKKNPLTIALGTWVYEIDEKGNLLGKRTLPSKHKDIYQMMYYAMGLQHPTIMFNRKLVPKNFNWYQDIKYAEDLDLLFRLCRSGKLANLGEFLMFYRIHKDNLSLKRTKATFFAAQKIRQDAVKFYHYKPSLITSISNFLANIIVSVLPEKYILNLYSLFRKASFKYLR